MLGCPCNVGAGARQHTAGLVRPLNAPVGAMPSTCPQANRTHRAGSVAWSGWQASTREKPRRNLVRQPGLRHRSAPNSSWTWQYMQAAGH